MNYNTDKTTYYENNCISFSDDDSTSFECNLKSNIDDLTDKFGIEIYNRWNYVYMKYIDKLEDYDHRIDLMLRIFEQYYQEWECEDRNETIDYYTN